MKIQENEKTQRLQEMLQEALNPLTDKLQTLEQEIEIVRKGQDELKKMLEERQKNS
ncbi:MAG TPA: hypothetical protein VK097_08655 [Lentibacillus sp.]|uniref:hypothetical protein n=1 Tax=Lentibacillus TaxID=175304 RepID=UPI0012D98ECE|nr:MULTISPECIES: hypothetical protein [Lentibacillus]MTW86469.1 hypothetical protein [Virgibacillus dakarensis]HLR62498.1 hypothetical protein [Lentibacillus sp.]